MQLSIRAERKESMILKKCNALLALLSILGMLIHVGYSTFAYLTFYYNPALKTLTAVPFLVCVCLHAILGMTVVFLQGDGTRLDQYPKKNLRTILQRVSAALIFPMLIVHLRTFDLMKDASGGHKWLTWWLIALIEVLFFGTLITHVAVSFSKALITLGWLKSQKVQRRIDVVVYVLGALIMIVATFAVLKGQIAMFLVSGGEG